MIKRVGENSGSIQNCLIIIQDFSCMACKRSSVQSRSAPPNLSIEINHLQISINKLWITVIFKLGHNGSIKFRHGRGKFGESAGSDLLSLSSDAYSKILNQSNKKSKSSFCGVAQLIERRTVNSDVAGLSPASAASAQGLHAQNAYTQILSKLIN